MSQSLNALLTRVFGKELGLKLRVYKPENVSKNNKVVYSYIYGIDDAINGINLDLDDQDPIESKKELQPVS